MHHLPLTVHGRKIDVLQLNPEERALVSKKYMHTYVWLDRYHVYNINSVMMSIDAAFIMSALAGTFDTAIPLGHPLYGKGTHVWYYAPDDAVGKPLAKSEIVSDAKHAILIAFRLRYPL